MALRCLLFSSDEGTAQSICQVLADLGIEAESCSEAVAAVERVTNQSFQIVIIDWDKQPEAGFLLTTTRERKAAERPLTLAIVSDDGSVPKALQAGANSILRKPVLVNQVKDTLKTARDLLRARQEAATAQAAAAAASAGSGAASGVSEPTLRAGEFLQSAPTTPGGQFVTDSDVQESQQGSVEPVDALKELEPMAAAVVEEKPAPASPPPPSERRGLEWYKARLATLPGPPTPPPEPPKPPKPELLGFDQMGSHPAATPPAQDTNEAHASDAPADQHEQKKEAELFAYIAGEREERREKREPRFRLGKKPIVGALVLAACAVAAAPQAPWHPALRALSGRGQQALHAWLNPQPVTPQQAPESHENFGRAGDEYKLPVAENIPDATTDPSQIQVVPAVDPTIRKPNVLGGNAEPQGTPDAGSTNPGTQPPTSGVPVQESPIQGNPVQGNQPISPSPQTSQPANGPVAAPSPSVAPAPVAPAPVSTAPTATEAAASRGAQPASNTPAVVFPSATSVPAQPVQPKNPPPHTSPASNNVPSSLKSQIASMTPDASGNKPLDTALPSIEPVDVPEATERTLVTDQPAIAYPASAKGQQGTVVLQVLIGRDGTVQDAKFLQGSLAFARAAIDGVKQWKFKPYIMNGRPVSVQTKLTMGFKPAP
jgi:protein TonB